MNSLVAVIVVDDRRLSTSGLHSQKHNDPSAPQYYRAGGVIITFIFFFDDSTDSRSGTEEKAVAQADVRRIVNLVVHNRRRVSDGVSRSQSTRQLFT